MATKPFGAHPVTAEPLTLTTVTSRPRGLIEVSFTNVGASIVSWKIGRIAKKTELVLGFDDGAAYLAPPSQNPYFGATIGRIANRIDHATLRDINGKDYHLTANEGENVCHSGPEGFHHRIFTGPIIDQESSKQIVTYDWQVKHLEDKFPGSINVFVKYTVEEEEKPGGVIAGKVGIEYDVRLIDDEVEETAIAMTNHSYFNIADGATIAGTTVQLMSATKQDVDDAKIPTGTLSTHPDIRMFTASTPLSITLGDSAPAFDHCFVLPKNSPPTIDTRALPLRDIAHLFNEKSRVNLLASTTEPAFQFYTGDGIDLKKEDGSTLFGPRAGLCLEAGRPINAVNIPELKKWVLLKKGEIYGSYTTYTAWLSS